MSIPEPKPGLVVRYDFRWTATPLAIACRAKTDRSALWQRLTTLSGPDTSSCCRSTHTPRAEGAVDVELPARVKAALGLDDARSWVIVSEHNIDEWPNAGLSPVSGRPGHFAYGFIPPGLFARIRTEFLTLARNRRSRAVRRNAE